MRVSIKTVLIGLVVGLQLATVAAILASMFVHLAGSRILPMNDTQAWERYLTETLRLNPQFAGMYYGGSNGEFFYVNRSDDRSPDGMRTKLITFPEGGRHVAMTWRDRDGQIVAEQVDPADNFDPRLRPWFRKAVDRGTLIWTDPYVFFTSRQPGITVAAPVTDAQGRVRGVVGVDIEITRISAFLGDLHRLTGGSAVILSRSGDVIAHPEAGKIRMPTGEASGALRFARIDELDDPLARDAVAALGSASFAGRESGQTISRLIDAYDNFANELLMVGRKQTDYERLLYGEGELKRLFKAVKAGAARGIDRVFITGVSPVVLSDNWPAASGSPMC